VGHLGDFMEYADLRMGQDTHARQVREAAATTKKFGLEQMPTYPGLAGVEARFALERGAWKEAGALEPRGSHYAQAEAITHFARALGAARSGDFVAAQQDIDKMKELRTSLEKANQSYWAEQ